MKELIVILSSTWKFAATFPIAVYLFQMNFFETVLYTNIGGLIGLIVFTMISKGIIRMVDLFWPKKIHVKLRKRKTFTRRNRWLVLLKTRYGLPGIIILTPILLSIPIGVFLNTKYYGHKKISYLYLFISQIVWSLVMTIFLQKLQLFV